ncbi:MAG: sensor histidine kinase, partial [Winogradskyella sp.]
VKINLYRILQEGLQNIIKHAQAKQVVLDFSVIQNQLVMKLTDNGVGFSTTENSNGIGTKNITSRVKDINGTIDITSKKGKGTTIHISVPYKPIS